MQRHSSDEVRQQKYFDRKVVSNLRPLKIWSICITPLSGADEVSYAQSVLR